MLAYGRLCCWRAHSHTHLHDKSKRATTMLQMRLDASTHTHTHSRVHQQDMALSLTRSLPLAPGLWCTRHYNGVSGRSRALLASRPVPPSLRHKYFEWRPMCATERAHAYREGCSRWRIVSGAQHAELFVAVISEILISSMANPTHYAQHPAPNASSRMRARVGGFLRG